MPPQIPSATDLQHKLQNCGKAVLLSFPLYPPLELFHALGFHPVTLWGLGNVQKSLYNSDRHLQSYTCSVGRHIMEFMTPQDLSFASAFFMYNACDTLRNLPELIHRGYAEEQDAPPPEFSHIHIPVGGFDSQFKRDYFAQELKKLAERLGQISGVPFFEKIFYDSKKLYSSLRQGLRDLENLSVQGRLSFGELARLTQAIQFDTPEDQLQAIQAKLSEAQGQKDSERQPGPRVILSGILPPPPSIIQVIEEAGLVVAGNDLAFLHRSYGHQPDHNQSLTDYYIDFYQNHVPCPTLLFSADERLEYLQHVAKASGAQGIIFLGEKYCEYEYFEFPIIQQRLKDGGLATLQIEITADTEANVESLRTRIDAFAELF